MGLAVRTTMSASLGASFMHRLGTAAFAAAFSLAVLAVPGPAAANLLVNPGFETGDFTGWTRFGNTSFTGVLPESAFEGSFGAIAGPVGSTGGIQQTIVTDPGAVLTIGAQLSNFIGFTTNFFAILLNGVPIFSLTDAPAFGFTPVSATATGSATGTNVIGFEFRNNSGAWNLDATFATAASVPVPEPATLALFGVGLVGLGLARRRGKARAPAAA
jgi:hypothetical protein